MGALLPTIQANHLREGLTDYLTTTFALTDADAHAALSDFVGDPETGMFKGPYVRLRLPFAPAAGGWARHLDWHPGEFPPYGHQAAAFERLSTKFQDRPQPTLVTTGTGSGKTEAFLYPIIDHVLRTKAAGVNGMKALILYPMNALANDQAERLAQLIAKHSELSGVSAGLYTGEHSEGGRTKVSEDGLITDRKLMQAAPPDILLTNYKMLDHLLLHPDRSDIWRLSAESLQYVVLDEFHTYDGAQGTDVAMLLRRLGLTVKAHWTSASPATEADRARPLGRITPVATSATLGSKAEPAAMLTFAHTVFGEEFPADAVIGETRLTAAEWLADKDSTLGRAYQPITPDVADAAERLASFAAGSPTPAALTAAMLSELFERAPAFEGIDLLGDTVGFDSDRRLDPTDLRKLSETEQLALFKGHPIARRILDHAVDAISLQNLADAVLGSSGLLDSGRVNAAGQRFLNYMFAALSHLRAKVGRTALNVDVHLWIRELSRIDRAVATTTQYRWSDDGIHIDDNTPHLPAVYCRHCGRSGWGARLAPTGNTLDVTDEAIRGDHASGASRFRALISAPAEHLHLLNDPDKAVEGLRWLHIDDREIVDTPPDRDSTDELEGKVLPVLTLTSSTAEEDSKNDTCPACGTADGIRFLGSAVATQLSVTLSSLFGDANLDTDEKKALMFTDSVQDAAHRAGFVQARSHTLSLRSTLRSAISDTTLTLADLLDAVIKRAGDDPARRYHLLAPDIVEHDEFVPFWKPDATTAARKKASAKVLRRVQFDIDLEFGLQSRLGRTLELTGSAVAEVNLTAPRLLGRAALNATEHQLTFDKPTDDAITRWVRGTVERVRTRGAIVHPWLRKYIEKDANRYWVWGRRPKGEGMPAFPKGRPAPAFPAIGSRTIPEGFDPITAPSSWYARWASQCLNVSPVDGGFLAKSLFSVLAEQRVLTADLTESGLTVYGLSPNSIIVSAAADTDLAEARHLLVCDVCQTPTPGTATVIDQLAGAPCLLVRCPGSLVRAPKPQNFYRRLYDSSEMKRVVAREHTSLLDSKVRLSYETAFKKGGANPEAPNVLVATPTLEMGIDIGDLSTVMLGSLPRTVSSYLQRVGRAGRLTGNSLALAFVRGRGEHLPKLYDPTSVIQGDVRPPATFLNAEEILQRQYVAHVIDSIARLPTSVGPHGTQAVLGNFDQESWMADLIELADSTSTDLLDGFLAQFDGILDDAAQESLRIWATPDGGPSPLAADLQEAVHRWNRDRTELTDRLTAVTAEMPEFERRAASPAATDDDRRDLRAAKGSVKLLNGQLNDLTTDYWISGLERYGVLPNYTLLDDSVTLDVGVTWIDPDSNQYMGEATSYKRGSRVALTELAPGATFYAQGLAARIDAVDLGASESNIQTWRLCPQCGWAGTTLAGEEPPNITACPRCGTGAVADISQQLQVVEMSRVSAEVRRDEAAINDSRDERHRESFTVVTAADIDPLNVGRAWHVPDHEFGAQYLRRLDVRWLNMGRRTSQGGKHTIAGQETTTGLFRVCAACGQLDKVAGRNLRHEHRTWCRHRNSAKEHVRDIALARTLRTQGVLLHLPKSLEYDNFAHPSLSAAILLGLRQVIGGSPEHLDVATITDALRAPSQHALLIHDTVPGGTGYLAEFSDPAKVWAVLAEARSVVRDCDCADHDRLACHKCLLPFAPPHELDRVSRLTAHRILDQLLGVDTDSEPDRDTWLTAVTDEAPPPPVGSEESPLEKEFYVAFVERLRTMGATIKETPGTYGPSATIILPGTKRRTWKLTPQVHMVTSKPDFELSTTDSEIPRIAIFADGRAYHAMPGCNRVADDATKRAALRADGHLVWSFGYEDLQRFKANETATPAWLTEQSSKTLMQAGNLKPALVKLLSADPITGLIAFITEPDLDSWENLGHWLPMALMSKNNRVKGNVESIAEAALFQLRGKPAAFGDGHDMCWSRTDGALTITAAMTPSKAITTVVAVDDRDSKLEILDGQAWKDWLRLSNWFGLSANHRITTHSLLTDDTAAPVAKPAEAEVPAEWKPVFATTVSEIEKRLVVALAESGVPVPEIGYETDDGYVIDFAWSDQRVGVLLYDDDDVINDLTQAGWTLSSPDATSIAAALGNGES
ncbi:MAG: DEAD/DEAH box helicase [Gordonia amarae]